jgi:hypothetical protein
VFTLHALLARVKSFLFTEASHSESCSSELMLLAVAEPHDPPQPRRRRRRPA